METPILAMIPSGYKAGKLYSILPSDGSGDFTVSVDADATRINKEGLIEGVALNQARLTYDPLNPECPSLLLEPIKTNLVTYSQDFSFWGDTGVTVTSNDTISPDGTMNADKLKSTANNWRRNKAITLISGQTYTCSVYAKLDITTSTTKAKLEFYRGASAVTATFDLENKTIANSGLTDPFIKELGNGWYRIGGTFVANGTSGIFYVYPSEAYGVAGTMFYWGAQAEQSSYATSYVPTTNNQTTRTNDFIQIPSGLTSVINTFEGSVFYDIKSTFITTTTNYSRIVITDQSSATNRILLSNFGGVWRLNLISSSGTFSELTIGNVIANQRVKIAFTYSSTQLRVSFNGSNIIVGTGTYIPNSTLESLKFSNYLGSSQLFQGNVFDTRIYAETLTDAELIKLTT